MRIARVATEDGPRWATWQDGAWLGVADGLCSPLLPTGVTYAPDSTLLAPCEPRVVAGIAHNKTTNDHPLPIQAWLKSARTVVGPQQEIRSRRDAGTVNVEGELVAVIGRDTAGITVENAFDYVLGWTVVNDVTNVDRNAVDDKTFQGKGGYGYTPLGPWIETDLADPERVPITVAVNGEQRCDSGTYNLPSTVAESIVYVTTWVPLGPGDVIMTGAPHTFTPVRPGDLVEITLGGLGTLTNPVV